MLINFFCPLLISCSFFVIQCSYPIYSLLFLILTFFNASALVLLLGHDYLAALFIVLYVGAMCTFFLFALMILDIKFIPSSGEREQTIRLKQILINIMVALLFAVVLKNLESNLFFVYPLYLTKSLFTEQQLILISNEEKLALVNMYVGDSSMNTGLISPINSNLLDFTTQIYSLGAILYTDYAIYLIIASLILLGAMLGSIALTLIRTSVVKIQILQNLRNFEDSLIKNK